MSDYIDLKVVGQVIATGVVLGAGLPLVFALGLKALSAGTGRSTTGTGSTGFAVTASGAGRAVGAACLLVVLAAIVFGIYIITHKS